jgi:hypothetical protein
MNFLKVRIYFFGSLPLIFCFLGLWGLTGCGEEVMTSLWSAKTLTIDGNVADWEGQLLYLEEKQCSIGIQNDSTMLYLCLTTGDRSLKMKINGAGFTVWFDPSGGGEKIYGVHYPLGMASVRGESGQEIGDMRPLAQQMYGMMELIGPGVQAVSRTTPYLASTQKNVHVALRDTMDVLTIECSIPLKGSDFSLGTNFATPLSIRLETGEIKMPSGQNVPQGGAPGGGMGGGGRMGGGGGRMGGGGGRMGGGGGYGGNMGGGGYQGGGGVVRQPLQFSARVKLTPNPSR